MTTKTSRAIVKPWPVFSTEYLTANRDKHKRLAERWAAIYGLAKRPLGYAFIKTRLVSDNGERSYKLAHDIVAATTTNRYKAMIDGSSKYLVLHCQSLVEELWLAKICEQYGADMSVLLLIVDYLRR